MMDADKVERVGAALRPLLRSGFTQQYLDRLARAAIAEAERWLPMESAPKDGTKVLCITVDYAWPEIMWFLVAETPEQQDGWHYLDETFEEKQPAHWQPLPAPPKETETTK